MVFQSHQCNIDPNSYHKTELKRRSSAKVNHVKKKFKFVNLKPSRIKYQITSFPGLNVSFLGQHFV